MPLNKIDVLLFMRWLESNYALGFEPDELLEVASKYEIAWHESEQPLKDYVDPPHEIVMEHQNMDGSIYMAQCSCGGKMTSRRVAQRHVDSYNERI